MSDELKIESLNLKKPLDKMTAKELRELSMDKFPQIVGASGMDKDELLAQIKEVLGLGGEDSGENPYREQIINCKRNIKEMRARKQELSGPEATQEKDKLRKKIKKLKRLTRRLSAS